MGKKVLVLSGVVGLGLVSFIGARAGQEVFASYTPRPAATALAVSEWQADREWRTARLDDATHLTLMLSSNGALSAEAVARLAAIAPAAGPESIETGHAILALKQLGHAAVAVLNDDRLDGEMRTAKFNRLLQRDFDLPLMARFALGRHWSKASPKQQAAYVDVFSNFLLHSYGPKIAGVSIERFEVGTAQRAGKRDVMVRSRVVQGDARVIKLVWRMRQRGGQFRVIDVVAEGVSLALTKRQEFAAIIKASGGDVAALIEKLRQKSV
ncbi:MAG: ABC transporter substrate-binding protein [Alphaproteobacteria bacterium]|nr:ABC transporter substrate-binding protein [Alphaproteobacteria bacterium]MDP6814494.1 ABC transporter substrate-binding protein [Alphaproteobacteria bacterium]